jgi:hypothetical protein
VAVTDELALASGLAAAGLGIDVDALPVRAARAVRLADELGAARGPVLQALAAVDQDHDEQRRAVEVAAAGGRSVARGLVLAPPLLGPATALLVSDEPFAVWATPVGQVVLALAVACWVTGALVVRLLVTRALRAPRARSPVDDEFLDLVAVAVTAGLGPSAAVRRAGAVLDEVPTAGALALWLELGAAIAPPTGWEEVGPSLGAAVRDGRPLGPLLRAHAATRRRAAHHEALQRAARLGPRLTVPTTLLLLPAAGLVVAAPLVHGLVAALS